MKKSGLFAVAFFLTLSSGAFAADSFDQNISDILETVETLKAPPQGGGHGGGDQHPGGGINNGGNHGGHNTPQPPMPHPQPVNPGNNHGNDNHGGFPGNDHGGFPGNNDWNNNHGGFPNNNDWNHQHPQPPYHGPVNECTDLTFKADTPNPFSTKIYFYDYQGTIHDQKVSLNIGQRDLKPWESEIITVCDGNVTQNKSLFNYSVTRKETNGFGSFFTGTKSYEYTMVPTGRKAANPASQGLDMVFGGVTPNNTVAITIADKWASFYQGQQVTLNLKIMRVPANVQNMPVQDMLEALKETNISVTYPVSTQYQIQLFDKTLPGTYMVTVSYVRDGASMQQMFTFAI